MAEKLLLQARCEDGENIHISTEWNETELERVMAAFVLLGAKLANDIAGEGGTQEIYKEFEMAFRKLQSKEVEAEIRRMTKEE